MFVDAAHAAAAASRHGLDENRIADLIGLALEERRRLLAAVIARNHGHMSPLHERLGMILEGHGADSRRRRADKHHAGLGASLSKLRILRQKTIARMHALRAGAARRVNQPVDRQIAFQRRRRPDRHRFIADAGMERADIGLRVDRDRAHAEPRRRTRDANCDLAAIGDQD